MFVPGLRTQIAGARLHGTHLASSMIAIALESPYDFWSF